MKNPGVYRASKDIDIAIIWPNCFYVAIFMREQSQLLSWLKKTLFWMILIRYNWNIVESGVKHHKTKQQNQANGREKITKQKKYHGKTIY
jgi:hypothetical protein